MEEIWKYIKGYAGIYKISNMGRVKSLKFDKEKIMNPAKDGCGYLQVSLSLNGIHVKIKVHRLVCLSFLHNPENKETVNHINGIKTDNRLCNLEWATRKENSRHAVDIGLIGIGDKHHASIPIEQLTKDGEFIEEYAGSWHAGRITGINQGNITKCCKCKLKSAGGFIWKYKDGI